MNHSAARAKAQSLRRQIRKGKYLNIPASPAENEVDGAAIASNIRMNGSKYEVEHLRNGEKDTRNMHAVDALIASALMNGMKPELKG